MNKSMKYSWFKVPVKVEQIIEYLFSDTVQSQKTKSGSDEINQGQKVMGHGMNQDSRMIKPHSGIAHVTTSRKLDWQW